MTPAADVTCLLVDIDARIPTSFPIEPDATDPEVAFNAPPNNGPGVGVGTDGLSSLPRGVRLIFRFIPQPEVLRAMMRRHTLKNFIDEHIGVNETLIKRQDTIELTNSVST